MRRIGVLLPSTGDNPEGQARFSGFVQGLQQAGWIAGRNVEIDFRWAAGKPDNIRKFASELVASTPHVILAAGAPNLAALQRATQSIPVVFVSVADPVAAGYVNSLARPGGNITGFMNTEYGTSGKWLELLKEIAPGMKRGAVIRDLANRSGLAQFGALQSAAAVLGLELVPIGMRDRDEIERGIGEFAQKPNGGLIVPAGAAAVLYRDLMISLAARHRLPAVYSDRVFVTAGGLLAYGPDRVDQYRRAASYVDRILKGEKPADLPVQAPTKYELALNLKTARALGLTVPPTLLARADEVID
jgi:putative ABC transport system substrate-binding protein